MSKFGLNGYMCSMEEDGDNFVLKAWDEKNAEISSETVVSKDDLDSTVKFDDRAQVERIFAPVFAACDKLKNKAVNAQAMADAKAANKERAAAAEHESEVAKQAKAFDDGKTAADGTAPGVNPQVEVETTTEDVAGDEQGDEDDSTASDGGDLSQ